VTSLSAERMRDCGSIPGRGK